MDDQLQLETRHVQCSVCDRKSPSVIKMWRVRNVPHAAIEVPSDWLVWAIPAGGGGGAGRFVGGLGGVGSACPTAPTPSSIPSDVSTLSSTPTGASSWHFAFAPRGLGFVYLCSTECADFYLVAVVRPRKPSWIDRLITWMEGL